MKELFNFNFKGKSYEMPEVSNGDILEAVVADNYSPYNEERSLKYENLDDLDVELFFDKYVICEATPDVIGRLLADEFMRRAEPLKFIPDVALREFSIKNLKDNFLSSSPTMFVEGHVLGSADDFITQRYSVFAIRDEDGYYYGHSFLADFSKCTFDIASFMDLNQCINIGDDSLDIARDIIKAEFIC